MRWREDLKNYFIERIECMIRQSNHIWTKVTCDTNIFPTVALHFHSPHGTKKKKRDLVRKMKCLNKPEDWHIPPSQTHHLRFHFVTMVTEWQLSPWTEYNKAPPPAFLRHPYNHQHICCQDANTHVPFVTAMLRVLVSRRAGGSQGPHHPSYAAGLHSDQTSLQPT